jgi:hypothetical protein
MGSLSRRLPCPSSESAVARGISARAMSSRDRDRRVAAVAVVRAAGRRTCMRAPPELDLRIKKAAICLPPAGGSCNPWTWSSYREATRRAVGGA